MRLSRQISGLVLALTCATASATPLPLNLLQKEPAPRYVLVRVSSDDAEEAARVVAGIGRLDGRFRGDKRIRVKLDPGVSMSTAIFKLSTNPSVASVNEMQPYEEDIFATTSLSVMDERVRELRSKANSRSQAAKDEVVRLQNIRNSQMNLTGLPEVKNSYKGTGLGYYEARQHYIKQRAYPNDSIDKSAYYKAVEHRAKMSGTTLGEPGDEMSTMAVSKTRWEFIGPRNLDAPYNLYFGDRPAAGRVNAIDYWKSNPNIVYAGAAGGGVWRSADGGTTWSAIGDRLDFMNVSSIATNPLGNQLFVGTGDFPGWGGYSQGLLRSDDSGKNWQKLGTAHGFDDYAVSDIQLSPDNPNILLVSLGRGDFFAGNVWRSVDAGLTWTQVIGVSAAWSDLSVGVKGPSGEARHYYAGASGGLIYRSSDDGQTWTALTGPFNGGNTSFPIDVAASQTDRNTVYAMDNTRNMVFKSTNAGASWTDITGNLSSGPGGYNFSQSWYDTHLTVVKNGATDRLYAGLVDIQECTDLVGNWRTLGYGFQQSGQATRVHVDHHTMVFNPSNPNEALVGSDGGVYRFVYNSGSDTWTFTGLSAELGITQFYAFDVHPTDPDIVIGGTQDNSTPYSKGGDLANWDNVAGGDGGYCAINPLDPNNMYATSQFLNVYRTDNDWTGGFNITPNVGGDSVLFIAPIELDKNNPDNLYAGTNYLWRYNKSTGLWTARLGGQSFTGAVSEITIAPGDSNRIYVGTSNGTVWYTANAGATWTQINTGSPSLPNRYITSISVNPANVNDVLVGVSGTGTGHLWRCTNVTAGTRVWSNVSGSGLTGLPDIPLNDVIRDPDDTATSWHVATDIGVFTTFNGGSTWTNSTLPLGLPNVQCNMLKLQGRNLFVATFGRGIWRMELPVRNSSIALSLDKTTVGGSQTATGTITLGTPAPAGGLVVSVSSSNAVAIVPATVSFASGETTKNFTINTENYTFVNQPVTVYAGVPGFVASQNLTVIPNNSASFVAQTVPTNMIAGQTYPVEVRYRNVGGALWLASTHKLRSVNPWNNSTWGSNRMLLPQPQVGPSGIAAFRMNAIAPETAGTYNFQWRPIHEGVQEFGLFSPNVSVTVTKANNAARVVSVSAPSTVTAGSSFWATVTVKNVGNFSWTHAAGYRLVSRNPAGGFTWGFQYFFLGGSETIAPGQTKVFVRQLTAPSTPGQYNFQWSMYQIGNAVFGDISQNQPITVTP